MHFQAWTKLTGKPNTEIREYKRETRGVKAKRTNNPVQATSYWDIWCIVWVWILMAVCMRQARNRRSRSHKGWDGLRAGSTGSRQGYVQNWTYCPVEGVQYVRSTFSSGFQWRMSPERLRGRAQASTASKIVHSSAICNPSPRSDPGVLAQDGRKQLQPGTIGHPTPNRRFFRGEGGQGLSPWLLLGRGRALAIGVNGAGK